MAVPEDADDVEQLIEDMQDTLDRINRGDL